MGRPKKYFTEEERIAAKKEQMKRWGFAHRKRQPRTELQKKQLNRAGNLVGAYRQSDTKLKRGKCTITAKWIIDNIFSSKCVYCGESDWHKLGCNRLDNSKPHTPENVEPCCEKCNKKLVGKESKKVLQYTIYGEFVREWESTSECGKNGFSQSAVSSCCLGKVKTHKGCIWKYKSI